MTFLLFIKKYLTKFSDKNGIKLVLFLFAIKFRLSSHDIQKILNKLQKTDKIKGRGKHLTQLCNDFHNSK